MRLASRVDFHASLTRRDAHQEVLHEQGQPRATTSDSNDHRNDWKYDGDKKDDARDN